MLVIHYTISPYIKLLSKGRQEANGEAGGQVAIKVRWNFSQTEVSFFTEVYANVGKWSKELRRAKKSTVHTVRGKQFYSSEINRVIAEYTEEIEAAFDECMVKNSMPTAEELKRMVNESLGKAKKKEEPKTVKQHRPTMKEMIMRFLKECGREKNWNMEAREKYLQAFQHITKANPRIKPDNITVEHMYQLRAWYVEHNYRNRTINKQIVMLKGFLKWLNLQEGITVPPQVLAFETNLKVLRKTVTFLHYDELMHFAHFDFGKDERLSRARDFWCFMAFTSLRVSDLCRLKHCHIQNDRIEMNAKKTGEKLSIPLTQEAQAIIERHKDKRTEGGLVFDIISPQKLNDNVKDAARVAGLDREIVETYYIGTERKEVVHKFYEIISNHDGRRTFVSCSLSMGIPAEVVMKCTGHQSYNTMRPYIETATETQNLEMEKWNRNQYRSQIVSLIDTASEEQLQEILAEVKKRVS